jgi:hypothetical protein
MGSNLSKSVAPGGIQDSQEGLDYQWKSLVLFAGRCFSMKQKVKYFSVLTEIKEAEKFDDIILEYTDQHNVTKWILAQAKHKKNPGVMDSNVLIADNNFSLVKYFASFWKISQKFGAQKIESVMIITNNTLAGSKKVSKVGQVLEMKIHQSTESFYFEKTDHFIFGSIGEVFKFVVQQKTDKREKLFEIVRMIILSYELASLSIKKPKNNFLSKNQKYLFDSKIIDENSLTFKQDFLNGTLPGFNFFSQTFDQALKAAGDKKLANLSVPEKITRIENQFLNIFNKTIDQSSLIANQNNADDAINEFLDKLLYVTKLETEDLQSVINSQLQETFKRRNVELVSASVEVCLKSWYMVGKNIQLTRQDFGRFISKNEIEVASMKMILLKKESFRDALNFSSIQPQIESFINNTSLDPNLPRILRLETPESETHFAAMRILANYTAKEDDALLFLKTSFTDNNFREGFDVFGKLDNFKLMIIELYKGSFQVFQRHETNLNNILQNDPSKKLVVIGDANLNFNFQNMLTLTEKESLLTDLSAESKKKILNEKIRFQDQETTWREVLNGHDLKKIPLRELLNNQLGNEVIVSKPYGKKIYIPRRILYNNCLKSTILQQNDQQSNDVFLFDKDEFERQRQSQVPHHLLQRSGNQLEWIESSRDLSIILKHIDESNPKSSSEEDLAKSQAQVTIVSDVAGMGKSSLFCKLAEALKESQQDYWIYKFDLNDHSEALNVLTKIKLCSSAEAINFIGEKILKLKSDLERNHFSGSCFGTGKVIMLFDGVDEIFSSYGEEVVELMKFLSQTKVRKIFISTRPECCDCLEKEFLQIKLSLQPFSESDQKEYFLEFLKNNDKFKEAELAVIVEAFLESMKGSISANDYKHTGVPLVTKLVAEFLKEKIPSISKTTFNKTVDKLKSEKFSLWILYESFISKSFDIYFREKCGMDVKKAINKRRCEEEKRKILENYKIFAIQQFLKKDAEKFFPILANRKFSDFEIEEMVKVGLIYKTEDGYKFVHQTFAENLFTLHLKENFEQPEVAEFVVNFVLVEGNFQVIRSFVEFWIDEKMKNQIYRTYFKVFLTEAPVKDTTPIHVSLLEQNSKILKFIYNCLAKNSNTDIEKSKVKNYFFECDKQKFPAIFYLVRWSENLSQFLDSVKRDFGSEFVLDIFRYKIQIHVNLLHFNSRNGEKLPELLKWIRVNFSESQKNFLKAQIFSVDKIIKSGILHFAFLYLSNEILSDLLDELKSWEKVLGKDSIRELILMEDKDNQHFLFIYSQNENFDTDFLIEILEKVKVNFESPESFLLKFIFRVDESKQTFVNRFCIWSKNFDLLKFLKWFHNEFGFRNLKELLLLKDFNQCSVIFNFLSNDRNSISLGLKILNFLKSDLNFDENFLKTDLILQKNEINENVLQFIFLRSENLEEFNDFVEKQFKISDSELKSSLFVESESETGTSWNPLKWIFSFVRETVSIPSSPILAFQIAQKSVENQEKYLNYLKQKFGENILQKLISFDSLFKICLQTHRFEDFSGKLLKFFDFIERNFGIDFLKKLICYKNKYHQTFLFCLFQFADKCLIKILSFLFEKFKNEKNFLEELLLSVDKGGNSFLIFYFAQRCPERMIKVSKEFFELIKSNFGVDFLKKLLLIKKRFINVNFHLALISNKFGGVDSCLQVLEILLEVVGKDKEFFTELTNQIIIPNEIREFLKTNLEIETKA